MGLHLVNKMRDYTSYINAVQNFYNKVAEWSFEKQTKLDPEKEELCLNAAKSAANKLQIEIEKLPQNMKNTQVATHIKKILIA